MAANYIIKVFESNGQTDVSKIINARSSAFKVIFIRNSVYFSGNDINTNRGHLFRRSRHLNLYLKQPDSQKSDHPDETNLVEFGSYSCVTRFLKSLLTLVEIKEILK